MRAFFVFLALLAGAILPTPAYPAKRVEVRENQLVIDGEKQPQLFGAEVQYFRLRGGYGPNLPRARVLELWNRALDKAVEAGMNSVSFYIPWDFHEYAEGKFDFTGTADEDGDGNADYPSRDVITFIRLVKEHGIRHVMVRPGPYINAEWGFLGFGAIPEWFHDKYPESHMRNAAGLRTKLYDYHDPNLLAKTALWFGAVYEQVLKPNIGPGRPVEFLQLDNETNYLWQTIYAHDYGPRALAMYRAFLKIRYAGDLVRLNQAHHRGWSGWSEIQPPRQYGLNLGEDQDWYRYHDASIHAYLTKIRRIWEGLGVREPEVLFTLAESYNAAENGLLPNYLLRNDRGNTGLMTVNLYPKTFGESAAPLLNNPFKADLDVKAATAANAAYWGSGQEWAMGPEIQGGWWRGTGVSAKARRQTYLTVLGHGLKAFFVYYFNEGDNFGAHWGPDKADGIYSLLRRERGIPESLPAQDLPDSFWADLQERLDRQVVAGFDARQLIRTSSALDEKLYFDAPLDGDALPRDHFSELREIGARVVAPYGDFLARSLEAEDDLAFVKDVESHVPGGSGVSNVWASADWSAGLLGYLLNAGVNPHLAIGEISPDSAFDRKALVHVDSGMNAPRTLRALEKARASGRLLVSFLAGGAAQRLGYPPGRLSPARPRPSSSQRTPLFYHRAANGEILGAAAPGSRAVQVLAAPYPLFLYDPKEISGSGCEAILFTQDQRPAGYRCPTGGKGAFVQIGALLFDDFGNGGYGSISDARDRVGFLRSLLASGGTRSRLALPEGADQTVAFARQDPEKKLLWITVKSGLPSPQNLSLRVEPELLPAAPGPALYRIRSLLGGDSDQFADAVTLGEKGFAFSLTPFDSTVFVVEPAP